MLEIGPHHSFQYRQEVLTKFFGWVKSAESCHLIGASSMGKTRLMDFLMQADVQEAYLGDSAAKTLFIRIDINRISELTDWGFYELVLMTTLQTAGLHPELQALSEQYIKNLLLPLHDKPNPLKALRCLELTIGSFCVQNNFKLCFLFDEFDEAYTKLSQKVFAQLRAIRDSNKNRLCYALFLRNLPQYLRPPAENESFYELLSRNMVGIGPYTFKDTVEMIRQLEARKNHPIKLKETYELIYNMSGGHPGLVYAMFELMVKVTEQDTRLAQVNWVTHEEPIADECRKLSESLSQEERIILANVAQGNSGVIPKHVQKTLLAKGLLRLEDYDVKVFSPIFELYLKSL